MVIGGILLPITFLYLYHRVIHINKNREKDIPQQ